MSEPKLESEQSLKEQIRYNFDCSSDKEFLLQDMLRLVDELVTKIQIKIDKYKKELMYGSFWAKTFEEYKQWYDDEFPDSDNHGDTAYVAGMMNSISELEEVLRLLENE